MCNPTVTSNTIANGHDTNEPFYSRRRISDYRKEAVSYCMVHMIMVMIIMGV